MQLTPDLLMLSLYSSMTPGIRMSMKIHAWSGLWRQCGMRSLHVLQLLQIPARTIFHKLTPLKTHGRPLGRLLPLLAILSHYQTVQRSESSCNLFMITQHSLPVLSILLTTSFLQAAMSLKNTDVKLIFHKHVLHNHRRYKMHCMAFDANRLQTLYLEFVDVLYPNNILVGYCLRFYRSPS